MPTNSSPGSDSNPGQAPANDRPEEAQTTPFGIAGAVDPGHYMCFHEPGLPIERSDTPARADLKQEAVLAVLAHQVARGHEICTACEDLINQHAAIAWRAYAQARIAFFRSQRARRSRPASGDIVHLTAAAPEEAEPERPTVRRMVVRRLVREQAPGLSPHQVQRVVVVMMEVQQIRQRKRSTPLPDALRAALNRLRAETGLPLDTSIL